MTVRNFLAIRSLSLGTAATFLALLPASLTATAPKTHTVVVDKMKFGPVPTGVRVGDVIIWVNRDFLKHTATARDKSFNVELPPKTSRKTVIRRSGMIAFYCVYHPGMKGSVDVGK